MTIRIWRRIWPVLLSAPERCLKVHSHPGCLDGLRWSNWTSLKGFLSCGSWGVLDMSLPGEGGGGVGGGGIGGGGGAWLIEGCFSLSLSVLGQDNKSTWPRANERECWVGGALRDHFLGPEVELWSSFSSRIWVCFSTASFVPSILTGLLLPAAQPKAWCCFTEGMVLAWWWVLPAFLHPEAWPSQQRLQYLSHHSEFLFPTSWESSGPGGKPLAGCPVLLKKCWATWPCVIVG